MFGHRLRRWPNIKPSLFQRLVFSGYCCLPWSDKLGATVAIGHILMLDIIMQKKIACSTLKQDNINILQLYD